MNNVYGTKKPALITADDVDIFYHYRPSRNSNDADFTNFKKIDSNLLTTTSLENNGGVLPGMYNLRLPLNIFNTKGIYTVYIKPKEEEYTLLDVSTLAAYPNIRGIVINSGDKNIPNNNLVGYRVEYFDNDGNRSDEFRIITSNNKCEPVSQNMNTSFQKGVRYRFNESSNLIFCTVTPSVGMSFKSTTIPNIGQTNQRVKLINTKFNPIMMEIEMVEHDIETISYMLESDQVRNLEQGLITTFNSEGGIYHQAITGKIIDPDTGLAHDFRINSNSINNEESNILKTIKNNGNQ